MVQILIVTIVYFILYKYLIDKVGIEQLGIWSLILASTSVLNISNLGFSSSVIKYVAKYYSLNDKNKIVSIIHTSLLTVATVGAVILLIVLPFANYLMIFIVPRDYLQLCVSLLPFSLLSLWINIQTGIFSAALDGLQKIYLKNYIIILGVFIYISFVFVLVPDYKLFGVVYAQIIQSVITFLLSIVLFKKEFSIYPVVAIRWKRDIFKEMINYSMKFQGISIAQILYDLITKSLLTKFGGFAITGYYEMAMRLTLRIRSLVLATNQVLVPTYATLIEDSRDKVLNLYKTSLNYILFLTIPVFLFLMAFSPIISVLWIGKYEVTFVTFQTLLTIGWGINIYTAASYFVNLGIGELNWNLISHLVIGILNLLLGYILGFLFGSEFVIYSWIFSLIVGSLLIPIKFHLKNNLKFVTLVERKSISILIANFLSVVVIWIFFYNFHSQISISKLSMISFAAYILISGYFFWNHPLRKNLFLNVIQFIKLK